MFGKKIRWPLALLLGAALGAGCQQQVKLDVQKELDYCQQQATRTLAEIPADTLMPRYIPADSAHWQYVGIRDWTSGFWPGELWELYAYTRDPKWKNAAKEYTAALKPVAYSKGFDHDLGFMLYTSFGRGYALTKDSSYKKVLLAAADSLVTLYNPRVGTILSWPSMVQHMNWPHNTIIDNMINLELLFWASRNGGGHRLYDIAVQHANTTMKNQFRPDYSNYHVVVYDTVTGKVLKRVTHQGLADSSMWARGQAWAIYGFTIVYRETKDSRFLDFAEKLAGIYLKRLPKDLIPYWDFDDPAIPDAPRDASAAAVTASALLELSTYAKDKDKQQYYFQGAVNMLRELSSPAYQSGRKNDAFLMHSTGNKPQNSEINVAINYADYYYLEALLRLDQLQKHQPLFERR